MKLLEIILNVIKMGFPVRKLIILSLALNFYSSKVKEVKIYFIYFDHILGISITVGISTIRSYQLMLRASHIA
jgi:hypothetical protein